MSLPGCQQRTLDAMERALEAGEPRLTSMFAIFTRLNWDEGAPWRESLGTRAVRLRAWFRRRRAGGGSVPRWAVRRGAARLGAVALIPVLIAVLASAIVVGAHAGGPPGCRPKAASLFRKPARQERPAGCGTGTASSWPAR